jgi:hypothetical protein
MRTFLLSTLLFFTSLELVMLLFALLLIWLWFDRLMTTERKKNPYPFDNNDDDDINGGGDSNDGGDDGLPKGPFYVTKKANEPLAVLEIKRLQTYERVLS